ncbi:MAG TPA: transglycosylase domain-containing protein, partial [Saprospiraceae bacterium]|nr:transglycosylase domain-containing protein [Saprospiraceae bacterium]
TTDELRNIETANSTEIYTQDSVLIGKFFIENRTAVSLDNVSPHILSALIATEDRRFLEHRGIDFISWLRVVKGLLGSPENRSGGSTLTQQLAKNLYGRRDYHVPGISLLINKIRENFISIRLERVYTKEQLLNFYLNTVPFGDNAFGINVASRQFFNKKAKDLSIDQAATLVGMLKGTSIYNPVRRPERSKERRNVVLRQMVKNKDLTQAEYEELSKKPVGAKLYNVDSNNDGAATYFREHLRTDVMPQLLKKYPKSDGSPYNLYTDGLKIYTTLHSKMQQFAEDAVRKHMQELQQQFDKHWKNYKQEKPWGDDKWIEMQVKASPRWDAYKDAGMSDEAARQEFDKPVKMSVFSWQEGGGGSRDTTMSPADSVRYYFLMLNCGFMAMDHRNGYVRAWVGGTNFKHFKVDHTQTARQVGSTFKPIVYAAAVKDSIKPCTYFPNQIKMIVDWEPHNSDERYGGYYSMPGALAKSVNVVAAQLIEKVGIQKTIDLARAMGITAPLKREYGISLGACEVNLYDMIKVYGTLANGGKRPDPVLVLKVLNRDGEVVYDYKQELAADPNLGPHVQALSANEAATMVEMMKNVINYGTGQRLRRYVGYDTDFAGKTGTTQNQSDGWFICYNPQLVTGAWVGAESPVVRFRSMSLGQGSAMALPIVGNFWHSIITKGGKLQRMVAEKFPTPKPEVTASVGCYPWISIKPDSFNSILAISDSLLRDSLIKDVMRGRSKNAEEEASEAPVSEDMDNKDKDDKEKKDDNIFKKIFGRKDDDDKDGDKAKNKDKDPKGKNKNE